MVVRFMKLSENAKVPTFGNGDVYNAGFDFYSAHPYRIYPKQSLIVDTDIAWDGCDLCQQLAWQGEFEKPYIQIKSRSGNAFNASVEASNAGVIDAKYTGNIRIKLYNNSETPFEIQKGDRIAQGILMLLPIVNIEETARIEATDRGANGFGSTGR